MLDTLDSPAAWFPGNAITTINVADTAVHAQGIASLSVNRIAGAGTGILVRRWILPQDLPAVQICSPVAVAVSFFHLVPAGVTGMRLRLVYEVDPVTVLPTKFEEHEIAVINGGTLLNGFWLNSRNYNNASLQVGLTGNDDPARRRMIMLELEADVAAPAVDLRFDAIRVTPAVLEDIPRPCAVSGLAFGVDRLVLPRLKEWLRNPKRATTINAAPIAHEIVKRASWEEIQTVLENVRSDTLRESLRRFSAFAQARSNWQLTRSVDELVDVEVSVLSGVGNGFGDPRRVELTDTIEVARLKFLEVAGVQQPVRLRIGPNARREVEVGEVQTVFAGSHVILREPLTYSHEPGSFVRSHSYYPRCTLSRAGDPVKMGKKWNFDIGIREVV